MNTTQQIEQLEIAKQILEAQERGEPVGWEIQTADAHPWTKPNCPNDPFHYLRNNFQLRIKPFVLGNSINGHTLGEGQQWHRNEFTKQHLPKGTRPLLKGEETQPGDEITHFSNPPDQGWVMSLGVKGALMDGITDEKLLYRTTRPLPPTTPPIPEGYEEVPNSEKKCQWIEGAKWWNGVNWKYCAGGVPSPTGALANGSQRIIRPIHWFAERQAFARGETLEGLICKGHTTWIKLSKDYTGDWTFHALRIHDPYRHLKSALTEGRVIQWRVKACDSLPEQAWIDYKERHDYPPGKLDYIEWRIKPTATLVPWSLEDHPSGCVWVRRKTRASVYLITAWFSNCAEFASLGLQNYAELLESFTLIDGSPCGNMKEVES